MKRLTSDPSREQTAARRVRLWELCSISLLLATAAGCKRKDGWLIGSWVMVDPAGKPGLCRTFAEDRTFTLHATPSCKGKNEAIPGGKWQLKAKDKLAVQDSGESAAHLAHIGERDEQHFVARGALAGTFYRVGEKGADALLAALERKGVFKVKPLPAELGCAQLAKKIGSIRSLRKEPKPRMLRANDQGLKYRREPVSDPTIAKVVYAINQDQLDWIAFHLAPAAFSGAGPAERLTRALGPPHAKVSTGKGSKRQQISMWRGYCKGTGKDDIDRDIDVTLFAQAGEKTGYFYVSEGVVSQTWADLQQMASDPALADDGEDEPTAAPAKDPTDDPPPTAPKSPAPEKDSPTPANKRPEPRTAAAPKPPPAAPAPKEPEPAPARSSSDQPPGPDKPARAAQPAANGTIGPAGRPMVPGREDEI